MRPSRIVGLVTYCIAAIALVLGCSDKSTTENAPTVVAILAITGKADFIGKPEHEALKALAEDLAARSGLPFKLEYKDSAGDPNQARQEFDSAARREEVIAIIGPSTSGESIPLAEAATRLGIPLLSLAASKKIVVNDNGRPRDFAFKFAQNDDLAARLLVAELHRRGHSSVALLFSNDGFGKSGAEVFQETIDTEKVVTLAADSKPFDPAVAQPDAVIESLPKDLTALVIWGTAPGPALLVQSAKRLRPDTAIFLSHGNASPSFIDSAGAASEGAIVVGSRVLLSPDALNPELPADEAVLQFQRLWRTKFGTPPSHFGGHARDAFAAMVKVFEIHQSPSRTEVRDVLEGLTAFNGVTGTFNFSRDDHAGLGLDAFAVYEIRSGKFVPASEPR